MTCMHDSLIVWILGRPLDPLPDPPYRNYFHENAFNAYHGKYYFLEVQMGRYHIFADTPTYGDIGLYCLLPTLLSIGNLIADIENHADSSDTDNGFGPSLSRRLEQ